MKVRLNVSRGGLDFSQVAGQEIEVSSDEARRMEAEGQCTPLEKYPAEAKPEDVKPAKAATKSKTAEAKPETDAASS